MTVTPLNRRQPAGLRERVAQEVRAEIARAGFSVNAAAKALEWTQPYLQRRISGKTAFDVDDLEKISRWLGVPVERFLAGNDAARDPANMPRTGTDTGSGTGWYLTPSSPRRAREAVVIDFPGAYRPVSNTG
jgi:transcriptional regulator with XRE-family HTH domain